MREWPVIGRIAILVPFISVAVVHDLARTKRVVTVGPEVSHHGARVSQHFVLVPMLEAVELRSMWIQPAHHAGSRWTADRAVAVRLPERYPALNQPLDVRRLRLGVSAETLHVVIEIIADDEKDVGAFRVEGEGEER